MPKINRNGQATNAALDIPAPAAAVPAPDVPEPVTEKVTEPGPASDKLPHRGKGKSYRAGRATASKDDE